MNHPAIISVIVGALVTFFFWGFQSIAKEQRKLRSGFLSIEDRARAAKTETELLALSTELSEFYRLNCWHRTHGDTARRVMSYIKGKVEGIRAGKVHP